MLSADTSWTLDTCCPVVIPGITQSKQETPKHAFAYLKKPSCYPRASFWCLFLLGFFWALMILQLSGLCKVVWQVANVEKHWYNTCFSCSMSWFPMIPNKRPCMAGNGHPGYVTQVYIFINGERCCMKKIKNLRATMLWKPKYSNLFFPKPNVVNCMIANDMIICTSVHYFFEKEYIKLKSNYF